MSIVWTRRASAALQREHAFLALENVQAANRTRDRILQAVERLPRFPISGRHGRLPDTRELVITSTPYIVIYRAGLEVITILSVFHTSRKHPGPVS